MARWDDHDVDFYPVRKNTIDTALISPLNNQDKNFELKPLDLLVNSNKNNRLAVLTQGSFCCDRRDKSLKVAVNKRRKFDEVLDGSSSSSPNEMYQEQQVQTNQFTESRKPSLSLITKVGDYNNANDTASSPFLGG